MQSDISHYNADQEWLYYG